MWLSAYNYKVPTFATHSYTLGEYLKSFTGTQKNLFSESADTTAAADKFYGSVNLPNGKVLFIPYSKNNVGLYTPSTGVYEEGPSVIATGSARYRGGCLHPGTGLVVMAPILSRNVGLYNTRNGQFKLGVNLGASPGYSGAVVSSVLDKVILVPGTSANIGIYDPYTDTFTQGPAHGGTTSTYFSCAEELPDGRILLIPYSAGSFKIFDPITNTVTTGPTGITSAAFHGSVKLDNGDVVCVPYSSTTVAIYRNWSGTLYTVAAPAGGAKFRYGALAPDGRVIFCPNTYDRVGWYNPATDAYEEGSALGMGATQKFAGCTQASNGNIVFAPYVNTKIGRFEAVDSGVTPLSIMQSPQWNKN